MGPQRVFDEAQLRRMRDTLARLRDHAGNDPGRSLVSPLNRAPDVTTSFRQPPKIRDITLRTMEQLGVVRSPAERREFLTELAKAGVDEVVTTAVRRGHDPAELRADADATAAINPDCLLMVGSINTEDDIVFVKNAGYGAAQMWMAPFLGDATPAVAGAVYKRAWQGRSWDDLRFAKSPQDQIDRALRLIELSHKHKIKLSCSILILSYATPEYVASFSKAVSDAGVYDIMLGDHSSALGPEAWASLVGMVRENAPNCCISVHPHDMFGLATACALAGLRAGATTAEVAVNGLTDGPAQADLAHTVAALEILYGVKTNVRLAQLTELSRKCERLTGVESDRFRGLTGREVFDVSGPGDEYVQELKVDKLFHNALDPALVGNQARLVVSAATGPFSVWDKLEELGFSGLGRDQAAKVYEALQAHLQETRRALSDAEVKALAAQALKQRALT